MKGKEIRCKAVFWFLIKAALAGAVALAVLSVFCFLFSYSGTRVQNASGATDFKWMPNQFRSTIFEGYSWFTMDEHGFNNLYGTEEKPDVLLMGSSHMEAANIQPEDMVASRLDRELPLEVYNIAISGHTIYNCFSNLEAAVEEYDPSRYLIVETVTVELSAREMQKVIDGTFPAIESYDSGVLYLLQKYVPAMKTLYKQVDSWRAADAKPAAAPAPEQEENYREVLNQFLLKAKTTAEKGGAKLVIFYHPEVKIDENAQAYTEVADPQKPELFRQLCQELDILYLDMTQPFIHLYEQEHMLPYGFSNTAVGAAHLNKHGHRVISEELIGLITEVESGT